MNLLIKTIVMTNALCFCMLSSAQEHNDYEGANSSNASHSGHGAGVGPVLTRTENIESALADGGEPIVADVLGVVCER